MIQISILNALFSTLAVSLTFLLPYFLLFKLKRKMILLLPFIFSIFLKLQSVLYLELSGSYSNEGEFSGYYNNIFFQNLIIHIIFIFLLFLFFKRTELQINFKSLNNNLFVKTLPFLILTFLLCSIMIVLSSNNPIFNSGVHIDRFNFWKDHAILRYDLLFGKLIIFVPILITYLFYVKRISDKFFLCCLFLYIFFLLITGQKFNGIFSLMLFPLSFLFYLLFRSNSTFQINYKKILYLVIILFLIAFFITTSNLKDRHIYAFFDSILSTVIYRVYVLEGSSLFFLTDILNYNFSFNNLLEVYDGSKFLANHMLSNPDHFLNNKINIASSFISFIFFIFPWYISIFLFLLYSSLIAFLINSLDYIIEKQKYVSLFIWSYLYLWVLGSFGHASFFDIVNFKFLFFLVLLLIVKYVKFNSSSYR